MSQSTTRYTPTKIAELRLLTKACTTWLEARDLIAANTGSHPDNVTKMNRRHFFWVAPEGKQVANVATTTHGDELDASVETTKANTLEEVIALCGVDMAKWESKGFSVRSAAKGGHAWSARFARKKLPIDETALIALFVKEAAQHVPRKWAIDKVNPKASPDCLYVLNIQDLHLAKLAWGKETGGPDWDIYISERAYRDTVDDLIAKVPASRIEEVLVIIGSDLLQVDNDQSATTAGTYVDSDSRLAKVFEVAFKMLTDVIEKLAVRFRVRAVVVPGNHDATTSMFLGHSIAAWFRTNANVTIDNSPKSRKYVPYGKTLIGFDHGDETKLADLPLLLMRENQDTISQYRFQEVLTGHLHQEGVHEYKGVKVRIAPALCSADRWHSRKGFTANIRQSQGLLYQRENGLEAIYYSTPLD